MPPAHSTTLDRVCVSPRTPCATAALVCNYVANDCSAAANVTKPDIWVPVASNVVSLRVEYGRDTTPTLTTSSFVADTYDQITPSTEVTVPSYACQWARIPVVRFALVSLSPQFEKDLVTTAEPVWDGTATAPIVPPGSDWKHYRYKLFETVVPLRNIAWMGVTGC